VTLSRRRGAWCWQAIVVVNNTDLAMLLRLRELWGGSICAGSDGRSSRKPTYRWAVASRKARVVLEALMPHLVTKRHVAELVLGFQRRVDAREGRVFTRRAQGRLTGWALTPEERELRSTMVEHCRQLNQRGAPPRAA